MRSAADLFAHHLKCFANRDFAGIVSDYSPAAMFFSTDGMVRGHDAIRLLAKTRESQATAIRLGDS
jgi:hypothetical protein